MNKLQEIYLDNAATTKCLESSAEIAYEIMTESYGNPSSVHGKGFFAEKLLKSARLEIMNALGANDRNYNIVFTASGTESDNLAILGSARLLTKKGNRILLGDSEHPAVFECKKELENLGYEVLLIPNNEGVIDYEFIKSNLNCKTVLMSHMFVNNETGALYDIKKLTRLRDDLSPGCLIHTDAVQAFLKTDKKLASCGADMISISSHKIHAPKGIGALLYKKNIRLSPIVFGGNQESGLRSGTEALHAICAFANSAKILSEQCVENLKTAEYLHSYACAKLKNLVPLVIINKPALFSPYILSITVPHIKSEVMLRFLSEKGIYISAGSACSSKHRENRVLINYGLSREFADTTIRVSFSHFNTDEEIDFFIDALSEGINTLAKIK